MSKKDKKGFRFTTIEPNGEKKDEFIGEDSVPAIIGKAISDLINLFFKNEK